jgi:hypothetical protein
VALIPLHSKGQSNIMKIKGLIFFGLLLLTEILNAQVDFRPGYVIKANRDTLIGDIDYRGDLLMSKICRFKSKTIKEIEYTPENILAFRFNESKYFVSKEVNGTKVFLEFLIKGKVSIYYLRDDKGDHYFLEKEGVGITEIPYEEGTKFNNNKSYYYQSTKHLGILNYYMQDAPAFQSRIARVGKPEHYGLIKLAEAYHNSVCKDEMCIIFEKKVPLLKIAFEPFLGFGKFNRKYSNIGNYNEVGSNMLLWIPRLNEKIYFKTGLTYAVYKGGHFYKFPCQVQYIFPSKRFRPTVNIGLDLYYNHLNMGNTLQIGGGFIYKIKGRTFFSTSINSEFPSIMTQIMDDSKMEFGVVTYSLNIGLFFEL